MVLRLDDINLAVQYIKKIKEGDSTSFIELFRKFQPVVFALKRKYFVKSMDHDDWLQEGMIACYQSALTYDELKGLTFGRYFKLNLERRICSILRKENAEKRRIDREAVSFEEELEIYGECYNSTSFVLDDFLDVLILREELDEFMSKLSEFELIVFTRFLLGQNLLGLAQKLGCSEEKIKNALDRARRKLKNETNDSDGQ